MKYSLFLLKLLLQCYQRSKYREEFAIIFNKSPRNISNSPFSLWTSWKFVWSCHAILFFRTICVVWIGVLEVSKNVRKRRLQIRNFKLFSLNWSHNQPHYRPLSIAFSVTIAKKNCEGLFQCCLENAATRGVL